jgi:hypothetical protein
MAVGSSSDTSRGDAKSKDEIKALGQNLLYGFNGISCNTIYNRIR